MPVEPSWLEADDVVDINVDVVGQTGEPHLLRDIGLLEGALGRQRAYFDYGGDIEVLTLGLYLLLAIGQNHPFEQGNKRTAFRAMQLFLAINGYRLTIPDDETTASYFERFILGEFPVANAFRRCSAFVKHFP